jgi:hypothetical protein
MSLREQSPETGVSMDPALASGGINRFSMSQNRKYLGSERAVLGFCHLNGF